MGKRHLPSKPDSVDLQNPQWKEMGSRKLLSYLHMHVIAHIAIFIMNNNYFFQREKRREKATEMPQHQGELTTLEEDLSLALSTISDGLTPDPGSKPSDLSQHNT